MKPYCSIHAFNVTALRVPGPELQAESNLLKTLIQKYDLKINSVLAKCYNKYLASTHFHIKSHIQQEGVYMEMVEAL